MLSSKYGPMALVETNRKQPQNHIISFQFELIAQRLQQELQEQLQIQQNSRSAPPSPGALDAGTSGAGDGRRSRRRDRWRRTFRMKKLPGCKQS